MRRLASALIALAVTTPALATTHLCVGDAGAFVEDGGGKPAEAFLLSKPDNQKWVLSDESGKFVLKEMGAAFPLLDKCATEFMCERSTGYAGIFMRDKDGKFSISWVTLDDKTKRQSFIVVKGRCTKL